MAIQRTAIIRGPGAVKFGSKALDVGLSAFKTR